MSIKHMSAVWDHAPYSGVRLLVLLALADSADKDTGHCFPSVKGLAQRARLTTTRHVYAHLAALERDGWITCERHPGRRTHYRVTLAPNAASGDFASPLTTDASVTGDFASVVTLESPRSDFGDTGVVTLESPPDPVTVTIPLLNQERARTRTRIRAHARETLFPTPNQKNQKQHHNQPPTQPLSAGPAAAAWRDVRAALQAAHTLTTAEYQTWIAPLRITGLTRGVAACDVVLLAPGADHARIVTERYRDMLAARFAARLDHWATQVTIISEPKEHSA